MTSRVAWECSRTPTYTPALPLTRPLGLSWRRPARLRKGLYLVFSVDASLSAMPSNPPNPEGHPTPSKKTQTQTQTPPPASTASVFGARAQAEAAFERLASARPWMHSYSLRVGGEGGGVLICDPSVDWWGATNEATKPGAHNAVIGAVDRRCNLLPPTPTPYP